MDINDMRSAVTVVSFLVFIGIIWWAYSDRRQASYDEAARIPLDDDEALLANEILAVQKNVKQPHVQQQKGAS
jgi:cytochrome c oxidase cbb3-type subunit 4